MSNVVMCDKCGEIVRAKETHNIVLDERGILPTTATNTYDMCEKCYIELVGDLKKNKTVNMKKVKGGV